MTMDLDLESIGSPEQLAGLLEGRSDSEVAELVAGLGTGEVVGRVFALMPTRFDAGKAGSQQALIHWTVTAGDESYDYNVTVSGGSCTTAAGEAPENTDIGLTLALPVFLRLVSGTLNGTSAFMNGQLKLTGNVMMAMAMQSWFGM